MYSTCIVALPLSRISANVRPCHHEVEMSSTTPSKPSLADLVEVVRAEPNLSDIQKRDRISALNTVSKAPAAVGDPPRAEAAAPPAGGCVA